mmetsp:Transcript_57065/g.165560  ORF Transcript_57065/g.165560 Transcript_57065/m.165560 type:complete len:278 (-) Transcript_57065:84-917(-)
MKGVLIEIVLHDVQRRVAQLENRPLVSIGVTVVRRREHCDHGGKARSRIRLMHLEPLQLDFVRPDDTEQAVVFQEPLGGVCREPPSATSGCVLLPLLRGPAARRRVRPQQVADQPVLRRLPDPVDALDVPQPDATRRQAAVNGEELLVDDGRERQRVEALHDRFVHGAVVLELALLAEIEERGHLPRLVVAPQHVNVSWPRDLERKEEDDHLHRERPSVDVVAKKEVLRVLGVRTELHDARDVEVLTVNVADDVDRVLQLQQVGLFLKHLLRLGDQL